MGEFRILLVFGTGCLLTLLEDSLGTCCQKTSFLLAQAQLCWQRQGRLILLSVG